MKISGDIVVATFEDRAQAERAVAELSHAGLPLEHMDILTRGSETGRAKEAAQLTDEAAGGALVGAAAGAGTGAVAGALAAMLIPGFGTVLGGGLLLGALGGAALGAAGGTFLGPFLALDLSEEEAHYYASHLELGRTVVLVHTRDRQDEVREVLRRHGGRDYAETVERAQA
jgi:hypothetical protein